MHIEFFRHELGAEDLARVAAVIESTFLTTGPRVREFEEKFAAFLGAPEAVGLTSCTGALHLALARHGIGPGDEVVTTPMTFAATATAVLQAGATPVFADVCPRSGLLTPEAAAAAITPRTKGLLPVHLYGRMADMRGFAALAARRGLVLLEDSAHCVEGERDGLRPGQASSAACFSFYATKAMTCGEGGAVVCRSAVDAEWYRAARHHGIRKSAALRYGGSFQHWDLEFLGWKYNMDDIQAALLLGQVGKLLDRRERRQRLEQDYRARLTGIDGLEFIELPGPGETSGHHLFTVLLPERASRDEVAGALIRRGIGCAVNYRAVHTLSYFRERFGFRPEDFPAADRIGRRTLSLPLYPGLREGEVAFVCSALHELLGAA